MKAFGFLPLGVRLLVTLVAIASGFGVGFWRFRAPAPRTIVVNDVVLAGVTSMPASETAPTSAVALQARAEQCDTLGGVLLESAYPGEVMCMPRPASPELTPTLEPAAASLSGIEAQQTRCEARGGVLMRSALAGQLVCWPRG